MSEKPRPSSEDRDRERHLEKELVREHVEEEALEEELEILREREEKTEKELEQEHHKHLTKHFFLIFIINGEDFRVEIGIDESLKAAVEKALVESGNSGRRNPAEWEVRDAAGVLLEMSREIKVLGLQDGARLFLSLKVGAGGSDASRQ